MNFKKYGVVYLLIILAVSLFIVNRIFPQYKLLNLRSSIVPTSAPSLTTNPEGIKVIINFSDKSEEADNIKAENAYGALVELGKKENIDIKTKTYDFGVFVESIGGFANSTDKAWIYYVNGTSGDIAADKKIVNKGDTVEWKYEKPNF